MRKDKPSRTALKVAFNIVTLGSKSGMEAILPSGIVDATRKLLVASDSIDINFKYCNKLRNKKSLDRSHPTSHLI